MPNLFRHPQNVILVSEAQPESGQARLTINEMLKPASQRGERVQDDILGRNLCLNAYYLTF